MFFSFIYKVLTALRKNDWALQVGHRVIDIMTSTLVLVTNGTPSNTALHVDWTPACNGAVVIIPSMQERALEQEVMSTLDVF